MTARSYFLTRNIYMCLSNGQFIFLDIEKDRYLSLDRAWTNTIAPALHGWPSDQQGGSQPSDIKPDSVAEIGSTMVEWGLLTPDRANGKDARPATIEPPATDLVSDEDLDNPGIKVGHLWNFLVASISASIGLRQRSIDNVINLVARRKVRRQKSGLSNSPGFDFNRARRMVAIFDVLRPFYPRKYLCLYDSLALLEFLARYDIYPTWVYGVAAEPFNAHCWVQEASSVFNDSAESVRNYTPIMAV